VRRLGAHREGDAKSGQGPVDQVPDGIGFKMSTQRRANRINSAIETDRADVRRRWFRGCMERAGISVPAARTGSALGDITAPLMSIFFLAWAWFSTLATKACRRAPRGLRTCDEGLQEATDKGATNSLLSDHCFETFARPESLSGSPPLIGAGGRRQLVSQAGQGHPFRAFPSSPSARVSTPTLPHAPAGEVRWAERHDGKRDLYFQHAA